MSPSMSKNNFYFAQSFYLLEPMNPILKNFYSFEIEILLNLGELKPQTLKKVKNSTKK
jgi:hypothetical protein